MEPQELDQALRDAHDLTVQVSAALRRALSLASRAGDDALVSWITAELSGYTGAAKDIPAYRRPRGQVLGGHSLANVVPLPFPPDAAGLEVEMGSPPIPLKIAEIESAVRENAGTGFIRTDGEPAAKRIANELFGVDALAIQYSVGAFRGVLDSVRTELASTRQKPEPDHASRATIRWNSPRVGRLCDSVSVGRP
jgi:hypothetical protein